MFEPAQIQVTGWADIDGEPVPEALNTGKVDKVPEVGVQKGKNGGGFARVVKFPQLNHLATGQSVLCVWKAQRQILDGRQHRCSDHW